MKTAIFELTLEKLTYGGDAMGRLPDGRAIFVPFALPGERVRVRLTEEKKSFARGELAEILDGAKERITPRCRHFGVCGGCHFQHLPYQEQLEAKTEILRDQLVRIGKIESPFVATMVASPSEWKYRNHVQFHLTENGKPGYVNANGNQVFEIEECHLIDETLSPIWPQLGFEPESGIERVSLRAGDENDILLTLESDSPEPPELELEAGISVAHLYEDNVVIMAGEGHIVIRVLGRDFKVSSASFFQVNTPMAEKMVKYLLATLPVSPSDTLLDIYCGAGLFSAFFAPRVGKVIGIESSASACSDYEINLDEFDNVDLYEGAAEDILAGLVARIEGVRIAIVDPPRAGIDRRALDALMELGPQAIAYVSCDPSTLARDAKRLIEGGYALKQVMPFDLFPQTYHIESIFFFDKNGR